MHCSFYNFCCFGHFAFNISWQRVQHRWIPRHTVCFSHSVSPGIITVWRPSVTMTCWTSPLDRRSLRDTKPVSVWRTHHVTREHDDASPALFTHRSVYLVRALNFLSFCFIHPEFSCICLPLFVYIVMSLKYSEVIQVWMFLRGSVLVAMIRIMPTSTASGSTSLTYHLETTYSGWECRAALRIGRDK